MSYNKQTWKTGDVITAEKLNHMEDGIANPGYTVETQAVAVVPEQTARTLMAIGASYANGQINFAEGVTDFPDTLTITFQGEEYVCGNYLSAGARFKAYGAEITGEVGETIDWSVYPFSIRTDGSIFTPSAGEYTVKAEGVSKTATVTDDFALARGYNVTDGILAVVKGTPAK